VFRGRVYALVRDGVVRCRGADDRDPAAARLLHVVDCELDAVDDADYVDFEDGIRWCAEPLCRRMRIRIGRLHLVCQ
jgi:hypothetical protein